MYGFDGDFDKGNKPKKHIDFGACVFLGLVLLLALVLCSQVYLLVSYIGTY